MSFNEWGGRHPWGLMILTSVVAFVLTVAFLVYALNESLGEAVAFAGAFALTMIAVKSAVLFMRSRRSS